MDGPTCACVFGSPYKAEIIRNLSMRCKSVALALAAAYQIEAVSPSVSGNSDISGTASAIANNLMGYYNPANVGVLPAPYYLWEAGGM
jgi:hypothetical protein